MHQFAKKGMWIKLSGVEYLMCLDVIITSTSGISCSYAGTKCIGHSFPVAPISEAESGVLWSGLRTENQENGYVEIME